MTFSKQQDFFSEDRKKYKASFGGSSFQSNPKTARPISAKYPMHVVLKSEKAKGPHSFLRFERSILFLAQRLAGKMGVRILDLVVMSNHVHISLRVYRRKSFHSFLRALNGLIARKVLGVERRRALGGAQGSKIIAGRFFSGRPFSRIVNSGRRSFKFLKDYFELNRLEKMGYSKEQSRRLGLLDGIP
jgi:REP element-mobilizing transposase RayT